jgi:enterobactin synthetase component D
MHGAPFTCLPSEAQRVIALHRSIDMGSPHAGRNAARLLAAQLLAEQGATHTAVQRGLDRAPLWPVGFVGSISHVARFACVAVMRESVARAVGIDVECELAADQQSLVRQYCFVAGEWDALVHAAPSRSDAQLATLGFSAKEAAFKCLYPLVKRYFDFDCVRVVAIDEATNLLSVKVLDAEIARRAETSVLTGSFQFTEGHVFTAIRLAPG